MYMYIYKYMYMYNIYVLHNYYMYVQYRELRCMYVEEKFLGSLRSL